MNKIMVRTGGYSLNFTLGSVEPKTFHKFENGRMVAYSFFIYRDVDGNETHRTEPVELSSCGWDDGSDFSKTDYDEIMMGRPRQVKGFLARLFGA